VGDVIGSPMQVSEPDRPYAPDTNPSEARKTRHKLLDLAEDGKTTLIGGHMPHPHWGRLIRWEERRYWQAW